VTSDRPILAMREAAPGGPWTALIEAADGTDGANATWAVVDGTNRLPAGAQPLPLAEAGAPRVVTYSGSLGPSLETAHPTNWLAPGQAALERHVDRLAEAAQAAGVTVLLRPHARHVLSDVASVRRVLPSFEGAPVSILLEPAALLEASMLEAIDEHLERIFEGLGQVAAAVLLTDVLEPAGGATDAGDDATGPPLPTGPIGTGRLPPDLVRELLGRFVRPETPIIVTPDGLTDRWAWSS